jgi:hypothetical protein
MDPNGMDKLSTLADMAEIFGVFIVIGGFVFALMQMRQLRQQRREIAAIELFRFFGNPEFANAYRCILQLPDGLDKAALRQLGREVENSAMLIGTTMENIGVMVFHRIVPSVVVRNLMGNSSVILFRKLQYWIRDMRDELGNDGAFEWFEWLANKLEELEKDEQPAYIAHRDWKPKHNTHQF